MIEPPPTDIPRPAESRKPLLIFDGDCGFCRKWIARWQAMTGDRVNYAPYQEVADQFPQIPLEAFRSAVQLVETQGQVYEGAEAVYRSLATVPRKGWMLWAYAHVPLFAPISRGAYRFVAGHRRGLSTLTRWFWGRNLTPSTFDLSRRLFIRSLGLIYFIAFMSLAVQIVGLVGKDGIIPIADYLPLVKQHWADDAYQRFPTLVWYDAGDAFLRSLCFGGAAMGALLFLGFAPIPLLIGAWVFYLSLTNAGQVFMHFQWDILLLETGFLAIFFAPLSWRLGSSRAAPPSRVVRWLIVWLLFRLMFLSGLVKLIAGAGEPAWIFGLAKRPGSWWDLTALTYHYQTQPLPTWTAWYAHQLPLWFQKASVHLTLVAEIAIPFLLFGPRRVRHAACAVIIGFMALIGATGNYNFFNLLAGALCVACLDDVLLRRFVPSRLRSWIVDPSPRERRRIGRAAIVAVLAAFIVPASLAESYSGVWRKPVPWPAVREILGSVDPLRLVNSYGLFRDMTLTRPEIVVEGSNDGQTWLEYEFKWKPGYVKRRPGFVEPHQPRLDWQMWFAALSNYQRTPWFGKFLQRLLEGSPSVVALLERNPFPDAPPKFVRAVLYNYRFTDSASRRETGAWWRREKLGLYAKTMSLNRR
jgi:predicted DCC family thiol-disulfide oxidoreductase YuxK